MKKDIQKSVRLNQDTYDFILTFEGQGFNQKFENACDYFKNTKKRLDLQIDASKNELNDLRCDIYSLNNLYNNIKIIDTYLDYCKKTVENDMPSLL